MSLPELTVISVCKNCVDQVDETISSVLAQEYSAFEYIIIDGNSNDGTLEKIYSYRKAFESKRIQYVIYSGKDSGIYNAMNIGVDYAHGRYIYFLNMGDSLAAKNVLQAVSIFFDGKSIIYGDYKIKNNRCIQGWKICFFNFIYRELSICHQTVFSPANLLKNEKFDEKFRICADREWMVRCYLQGVDFQHINIVICNYDGNGVSSNYTKYGLDSLKVCLKYGGSKAVSFVKVKRKIGKLIHGKGKHNDEN